MAKTYEEINQKIERGEAVVVTAEEMVELVDKDGVKAAAKKVDVVTTGTFGPMCSSGAFLNFGHADPPIKMAKAWLNDVPIYCGIAAVDAYLGASELSETEGDTYGGAHVIQELIEGERVRLRAISSGTDCYPRREIDTWISKENLNQAYLFNPRNAYQNYAVGVNRSDRTIYTYMGALLPRLGNATYSNAGQLSPLHNDPYYRTIGIGTRIFLGGNRGFVAWQGTQHYPLRDRNQRGIPVGPAGTLALIGELRGMSSDFIRAARFHRYGVTMYVGVGIPIPVLDEEMAERTAVSDADISTVVTDYSQPTRSREPISSVTYQELRSGAIELEGKRVPTAPISSYAMARRIAGVLKGWIEEGKFLLSRPVESLPRDTDFEPLEERTEEEI